MSGAPPVGESPRPRKGIVLAIAAIALLIPLVVLLLVYRRGPRRTSEPGAPPPEVTATEEATEPRIRESAEAGAPPFGGLREPRDAALDGRGRLWIADFGNSRLKIFDAAGGYLGGWGGKGNGPHAFRDLSAVAISGDNIYVADTWNGRIVAFGLDGTRKGEATGLFGPRGVAVGPKGEVWAADTGNHRLCRFDAALSAREDVGKQGSGPGEFSSPVGVAVAPSGVVYVADTGNRRIVLLDSTGAFRSSWPIPGWERAVEPHLEIDEDGSLWATDPGVAENLLHLDGTGHVIDRRTSDDEGRRFSLPSGLALDRKNRVLYVVSSGSNVVSKLRLGPATGKRS